MGYPDRERADPSDLRAINRNTKDWHTTFLLYFILHLRPLEKGCGIYCVPGHTVADFEDQVYGRIVLNAISAPRERLE
jgi:hypothetical protein